MTQKLTLGLNYFLYGLNENKNRQVMKNHIKDIGKDAVALLPWVLPHSDPFTINLYKDKNNKPEIDQFLGSLSDSVWFDGEKKSSSKIKRTLDELYGAGTAKKYIIFDSVHFIAHSQTDPEKYYKRLLSFCNYHYHNNSIHFIILCGKVPVVFETENTLRHLWEFVDCSPFYKTTPSEDNSVSDELLGFIKEVHGSCPDYVTESVLSRLQIELGLINNKKTINKYGDFKYYCASLSRTAEIEPLAAEGCLPQESLSADSNLSSIIKNISDAYLQFNSDIYLSNKQSGFAGNHAAKNIKEHFKGIIGQESAIQSLIDNVLISQNPIDVAAAGNDKKPLGVFLFVGSSGVGKTRVSQTLKEALPDYKFLQINLGECPDQQSVNKLIGISKGYVDSEHGGILTEAVRLHSRHVLLFDELDDAHAAVGQLFYKIFEGEVKDGRGRKVSFKDCYIIMTTNKGYVPNLKKVPRYERRGQIENKLKKVKKSNKLEFSDAFLGRIQGIIHFNELSVIDLTQIAKDYFDATIRKPYEKKYGTEFEFSLSSLSGGQPPGLLKEVVTAETLFFELWALNANSLNKKDKESENSNQGARRLFQLMDEYLIRPLELYRVSNNKNNLKKIKFQFKPAASDLGRLSSAALLLIDDEENAEVALAKAFLQDIVKVERHDFDFEKSTVKTVESADVIMLDIFNSANRPAGLDCIKQIRDKNESVPIIIYSKLEDSPLKQALQNENSDEDIFGYVTKGDDNLTEVVFSAIRYKYLASNGCISISNLRIIPPHSASEGLIFELDFSRERTL